MVGGGGYACSSFGAGSGHFEYFVVKYFTQYFSIFYWHIYSMGIFSGIIFYATF